MKRVIYCGSTKWTDRQMIKRAMIEVRDTEGAHIVVHGAAPGADTQASLVAIGLGLTRDPYPAKWKTYRKAAGPIRNRVMLDTGPVLVVAFKDGFNYKLDRGGTENMVKIATHAHVPTVLYAHDLDAPHWFATDPDEAQASAAGVQRRDEGSDPPTLW